MEQICVLALVGLPAVGKTSFSKLLLETSALTFNVLHICYDNFLNVNAVSYKEQREQLLKSFEALINDLKSTKKCSENFRNQNTCSYQDNGHNRILIIADDNHYYRSMRYKLYQICRQFNLSYGQIAFECDKELAYQQNSLRSTANRVPKEVFDKMSKDLEIPQPSVYMWESDTFLLQTNSVNKDFILSDILPFLNQLFKRPLQPLPLEATKCLTKQSQIHELDLLLRKRIGIVINTYGVLNKKQVAHELNDKRKAMLKELQNVENTIFDFELILQRFDEYLESKKHDFRNA